MIELKKDFIESLRDLQPDIDIDALVASLDTPPSVSVKINRRKISDIAQLEFSQESTPVKWCESGFYLDSRPNFTLNPLLHAGAFYVQDASSMIYEYLVAQLLRQHLIPSCPDVLDLCAAPGGKSTSILNALPDGCHLTANEIMPDRANILRENLIKWGYPEICITNSPTSAHAAQGEKYDLVAVDAPCSGEGMMRKDEDARSQWGHLLVKKCADLQREILSNALATLRPGGVLIYSTCTFNRNENEENLDWLIREMGCSSLRIDLPQQWGIADAVRSDAFAWRFMPHVTRGEGLFVALVRKEESRDYKIIGKILRPKVIADGIPQIETLISKKGKIEIPQSEWALSTSFPKGKYPDVKLSREEALQYLRHEAMRLPADTPKGYVTLSYQGLMLGFAKNIGNRANNLYPQHWRIRH